MRSQSPISRGMFLILAFAGLTPAAGAPISVHEQIGRLDLKPHMELLADPQGRMTVRDAEGSSNWTAVSDDSLRGYAKSVFWLRFDLANSTNSPLDAFVSLRWSALDRAQMFRPAGDEWREAATGDYVPYGRWDVLSYHPAFRVPVEPGMTQRLYLRIQSTSMVDFPILLLDRRTFRSDDRIVTALAWFLTGIWFALLGYAALVFVNRRRPIYLVYLSYSLLLGGGLFAAYGNAFEFLWPGAVTWQNRAPLVLFPLAAAVSLVFAKWYLGRVPGGRVTLSLGALLIAATLSIIALAAAGLSYSTLRYALAGVHLVLCIALCVTITTAAWQGSRAARIMALCWLPVLGARIPATLFYLELLPYSTWTVYGWVFLLPLDFPMLWFHAHQDSRTTPESYAKSRLVGLDVQSVSQKLSDLLSDPQVTGNPNLRMPDVAGMLGIPAYQLSELLNNVLKKSFPVIVNEHRIAHAEAILKSEPAAKISDIAARVGFQSKSPFNQAFKRIVGVTPLEYRARLREEP